MLKVNGLAIGEGMPKICLPLTGRDPEALLREARAAASLPCDMIEWRADFFETLSQKALLQETLRRIRKTLPAKPLLFTVRTEKEGGHASVSAGEYIKYNLWALEAGADLIDGELSAGDETVRTLLDASHRYGRFLVGSFHDFSGTPTEAEMEKLLRHAASLGCDIAKLAVTPSSPDDVLALLSVSLRMSRALPCPLITVSMGTPGAVSRLCGETFGSAVTFGAGENSSAPGQLHVRELQRILLALHR